MAGVRSASSAFVGLNANTSWTIPRPAGVTAGDLLLAFAANSGSAFPTSGEFPQTGADSPTANGARPARVWLRTATGSEPADYTFGKATNTAAFGGILALTGADTDSPVDAAVAWGNGPAADTSWVAPSISPAGSDSLLICGWVGSRVGFTGYTVPGSMSEQVDLDAGNDGVALATEQLTASGATGTRAATPNGSAFGGGWNAFSIAIKSVPVSAGAAWFLPFFR